MSCVEAVTVDVRHNESSVSVTVDRQLRVMVNGRLIPGASSMQFSLRQGPVNIKRVSSLFMAVTGFSFRVLYDVNGKIYTTMEPFYSRRVTRRLRRLFFPFPLPGMENGPGHVPGVFQYGK